MKSEAAYEGIFEGVCGLPDPDGVFIFFGGWMLFDLRGTGIYRAGAVIALILAIAVCAWSSTAQKVEALEAELQELKKQIHSEHSESEDI